MFRTSSDAAADESRDPEVVIGAVHLAPDERETLLAHLEAGRYALIDVCEPHGAGIAAAWALELTAQ